MDAPHLGQQDRRQSSRRLATSVVSRSRCIPMNARVTFSSARLRYSTENYAALPRCFPEVAGWEAINE